MFVDASVWCAIFLDEKERASFEIRLSAADDVLVSPMAVWETVVGVTRARGGDPAAFRRTFNRYLAEVGARRVAIGSEEEAVALDAYTRFGKGRHPARLNLGDCFAYACAKTNGVPLLFKGDDFSQTDIASAV